MKEKVGLPKSWRLWKSWEAIALLLITLLAAALRLYRLPELPPGLHFDEAFKGVTAWALLQGAPPRLFFESDMGEEPIAIYLVAAALGLDRCLTGGEPWVVRLPSAVVGVLTIPLAWWLGRELFSRPRQPSQPRQRATGESPASATSGSTIQSERGQGGPSQQEGASRPGQTASLQAQVVGLGTALVLAILYWHLTFSRIGMEPILVSLFATLAFAALARGLNTGCWPAFALAGLALGGSLYTYKAGYFVPLVAVLFLAHAAVVERGFLRRYGRGLLLLALVALIVAAPIVAYFATHPADFLQRPSSVALAGGGKPVLDNLPRVLGLFFVRGDANPRSNLPGRPALDPFLTLLFLVGLGRALARFRHPASALPLLWLGVMILPTLLTEDAPHFGRAIGATPALALLCGMGIEYLLLGIGNWWGVLSNGQIATRSVVGLAVVGLGLGFSAMSTARTYFHTWGDSPDLFYAYDVGLTRVASYLDSLPAGDASRVYLTPTSRDHYTLQFLVQRTFVSFDGRAGLVFPPPGRAATVVVLLGEDGVTLPTLQQSRPDGEVTWTLADPYGRAYAAAYHLPASDSPRGAAIPDQPASATFGGVARLLGYSVDKETVAPGEPMTLTLYWQALDRLAEDYTVFTHLLGGHNPATNGPLWAGHDSQPDGGRYPTTAWQPGETILDVHWLTVPADAPPGSYQLEAGLYLLATLTRLSVTDAAGQPIPTDAALLGTIEVVGFVDTAEGK